MTGISQRRSRLVSSRLKGSIACLSESWVAWADSDDSWALCKSVADYRRRRIGAEVVLKNVEQLHVIARWSWVKQHQPLLLRPLLSYVTIVWCIPWIHRLTGEPYSESSEVRGVTRCLDILLLKVISSPYWNHIFSPTPFDDLMSSKTLSPPAGLCRCPNTPAPPPANPPPLNLFPPPATASPPPLPFSLSSPYFYLHFSSPFCCSPSLPFSTFYPSCSSSFSSTTTSWNSFRFVLCDVVEDVERWEELLLLLLLL